MIEVRGRGNLIRLREATHPVVMGTFRLTRPDGQGDYFLPADALAIVGRALRPRQPHLHAAPTGPPSADPQPRLCLSDSALLMGPYDVPMLMCQ